MQKAFKHLLRLSILTHLYTHDFLNAILPEYEIQNVFENGINVDLKNPSYSDGILQTFEGGVVTGSQLRIQARKISYTHNKNDSSKGEVLIAEDDLMVEFGDYIFIGTKIEYDIKNECGYIYNARTAADPWFFGGEKIELLPDKSLIIYNGFITTSPGVNPEWKISSNITTLSNKNYLISEDVKFQILNVSCFWIPKFKTDLNTIFDSPIKYEFRFGGKQGPRFRMMYEIFSWNRLKTFLRLEYRLNRGPGIGITTNYESTDGICYLETINYVAKDSSIEHLQEKIRFRFQGVYYNSFNNGKTRVHSTWDKLSDKQMPDDYQDDTLTIKEAGRTIFQLRHQESNWISNLFTCIQLNNFQTVKQELPCIEWRLHPYTLMNTGIVSETLFRAGYLDYDYATNLANVHDYCSTRFEINQNFYRPLSINPIKITPEIGVVGIYYGNSPEKNSQGLITGLFSVNINTHLHKFFGTSKHVIEPYACYRYFTFPTSNPNEHFIFDIDDGWYRLNTLRFGINNNLYQKSPNECYMHRLLQFDVYTNAFFDTQTMPEIFQKIYCDFIFSAYQDLRQIFSGAWNLQENQLDYFNLRVEWTESANFAIATEFRHRGPFDWRKVDYNNFILDSFRTTEELRASALSDRRDTLLLHSFYRFHPFWAFEFEIRSGWNRQFEPGYVEYQADLITNLGSAWNLKLSYQHTEEDHRIAFYFSLGAKKPNSPFSCPIPNIEF